MRVQGRDESSSTAHHYSLRRNDVTASSITSSNMTTASMTSRAPAQQPPDITGDERSHRLLQAKNLYIKHTPELSWSNKSCGTIAQQIFLPTITRPLATSRLWPTGDIG